MDRRGLGAAFIAAGFFAALFEAARFFSGFLFLAGFALFVPEAYNLLRYWFSGGFPVPGLECRHSYCFHVNGVGRVYAGVEVLDCRHGAYDFSEEQFWGHASLLFDTGFVSDVDYLVVNSFGRYFVVVVGEGKSPEEVAGRVVEALRGLEDALKSVGCSWRRLSGEEVRGVMRPEFLERGEAEWYRALVLAPLALFAIKFWPLLPLLASGVLAWLDRAEGYVVRDGKLRVYGLSEFTSLYTFPTYRELLGKARVVFQTSDKVYLALRIRPAPPEVGARLDALAYKKYELGTALDKLSILHSSEKLFTAARRRWERREKVYLVEGVLFARENDKRVLENLGLRFTPIVYSLDALH